jgi:hypothetical protein
MPEEGLAPEVDQDTPINAAPEEGKPAEVPAGTDNWEQRYNDLRPEFDRRNALLTAAEGQQGPEAQAQALRQLGIEVQMEEEEEAEPDPWEDPTERLEQRLTAQEERLTQREEKEQQEHFAQLEDQYIKSTLGEIEGKENVKLSDAEKRVVRNAGLANRLEDGRPDLQGAFDDLKGIKSAAAEEYRASKNTPLPPVGSAGEEKLDTRNPEQRRAFMLKDFEARQAADQGS